MIRKAVISGMSLGIVLILAGLSWLPSTQHPVAHKSAIPPQIIYHDRVDDVRARFSPSILQSEQPPRYQLIVDPEIEQGRNLDTDQIIHFRRATITDGSRIVPISKRMLARDPLPRKLEIVFSDDSTSAVDLPPAIGQRLLSYLTFGPPDQPFDCARFVHYLAGISQQYGKFDPDRWKISRLASEDRLGAGQMVMLTRQVYSTDQPVHFAMYLARGLYLSKFGYRGGLIVTTLREMLNAFEGRGVYSLEPERAGEQLASP